MTGDWLAANQAYLTAAMREVRGRVASTNGPSPEVERALAEARAALPAPAAIDDICEAFGLTSFERSILLLCAAAELSEDGARHGPVTFGRALATLPDAHWSALSPTAALRHWRLVEMRSTDSMVNAPLHIDERVLHALAGVQHVDARLVPVLQPIGAPGPLAASHVALAERLAGVWREAVCVELCGGDVGAARDIAAAAADAIGRPLWMLSAADVPADAVERDALLRLWHREVVLAGSCLLIDAHESADRTGPLLAAVRGRTAVIAREPLRAQGARVRMDVVMPSNDEFVALWQRVLEVAGDYARQIPAVAAQFRLDVDGVRAAARQLAASGDAGEHALWDAARIQARRSLEGLAQRIEPAASWDDLVLPAAQLDILRQIAESARRRATVQETWGVRDPSGRGLGIAVLFAGASGTGKTLAAEVIARDLRLDIYRIDLSQVVSKYIGETEKNLSRVFDAAEQGGVVLLFDEADALFGRRTEVKDSHDRYANIEVGYLLQRMESYRGVAILTTNARSAIDPAFLRRLRYVVQFPFPDAAARSRIWARIFPDSTPRERLDPDLLARLDIAGGNIRNIAVNAAFLAAAGEEPVAMRHLLRAARAEYAKLEKPLTGAEVAGWT